MLTWSQARDSLHPNPHALISRLCSLSPRLFEVDEFSSFLIICYITILPNRLCSVVPKGVRCPSCWCRHTQVDFLLRYLQILSSSVRKFSPCELLTLTCLLWRSCDDRERALFPCPPLSHYSCVGSLLDLADACRLELLLLLWMCMYLLSLYLQTASVRLTSQCSRLVLLFLQVKSRQVLSRYIARRY